MFQSVCQTCHGTDGNGIRALGPPSTVPTGSSATRTN
ncbi:hypothetical protein ACQ86N_33915 [Puia sp. P3]